MIPNNACTPCITAAAGTELAGASFMITFNTWAFHSHMLYSSSTEVYTPKCFIPHTVLLRQTFVHFAKFPTAASRRSMGRVSVPLRLAVLSDQLPVVALVGLYPAN